MRRAEAVVLIVEEDPVRRDRFARALLRAGYAVALASNAAETHCALCHSGAPPDVVVLSGESMRERASWLRREIGGLWPIPRLLIPGANVPGLPDAWSDAFTSDGELRPRALVCAVESVRRGG